MPDPTDEARERINDIVPEEAEVATAIIALWNAVFFYGEAEEPTKAHHDACYAAEKRVHAAILAAITAREAEARSDERRRAIEDAVFIIETRASKHEDETEKTNLSLIQAEEQALCNELRDVADELRSLLPAPESKP